MAIGLPLSRVEPQSRMMGVQAPPELLAIHTNFPGVVPPAINRGALAGAPAPAGLSDEEQRAYETIAFFYTNVYYAFLMKVTSQMCSSTWRTPTC